ncbi:Arylsulfatase [Thalassoglobus neptunius]|uniref:Arylsulfatase n=1 Tax=Thalassoglobus neptunius TaxID=1938619 RepID=A0A5C5X1K6_9PLAN|nr:sulfatase-like hydrolase/transferase [Thalassoglobus neptunius]TWT56887.1 Arylsulfatase [Thalassoglobus neptunius]
MTERPNILWYCTDQQRFDTIGALGNKFVQTPTIDALVNRGTAFTHAYCQSPICTPSRSSLMTGMYPSRLHNTRNGNRSFPESVPLISKLIAENGYSCGMIGKFHLQSAGHRTEPRLDDGFNFWKFSHAPRDDWPTGHDYADWVREQGADLDELRNSPSRVPPELHQTKWASDMAIEFLEQQTPGTPWLLNINVYDPHPPFIPPKDYADRFDPEQMPGPYFQDSDLDQQRVLNTVDFQDETRSPEEHNAKQKQADYYAMIAQIDDQLARILRQLEMTGQLENTMVVFTSDHGESLGDHGLMYKGCRFYEGLVRVPLIFSWPGRIQSSQQSHSLVELLDLTATLLDYTQTPPPSTLQGKSLRPILEGSAKSDHHRDFVRCEYFDALDPHFTHGTGSMATMYRTKRYKLCVYHDHNLGELYDLERDPWEFRNLWDFPEYAEIRNQLILESFNAHVCLTTDVGSERIAPM